jgi:hypothetical protein
MRMISLLSENLSSQMKRRLLLNPDLFRDGMLNPDLASPG